jgi:hypothetical protein
MTSQNFKMAWDTVKTLIDGKTLFVYQGVVDITDNLDFQDIGDQYSLTQRQYDLLINKAQEYANNKIGR